MDEKHWAYRAAYRTAKIYYGVFDWLHPHRFIMAVIVGSIAAGIAGGNLLATVAERNMPHSEHWRSHLVVDRVSWGVLAVIGFVFAALAGRAIGERVHGRLRPLPGTMTKKYVEAAARDFQDDEVDIWQVFHAEAKKTP